MASVSSIATVIPENLVTLDDLVPVSEQWLGSDAALKEKFLRIGSHSGVQSRRYVLPYTQTLQLGGLEERTKYFEEFGTSMLVRAIEAALETNAIDAEEVGALVFTSCSVPVIPSIDASAILKSSLPETIKRIPIFQYGCAGGVIGLSLGAELARIGSPILVASVELCSLVFQPENRSGSHLVGAAIFSDGAAATIVHPSTGKLSVTASESHLLPNTRHLMGYDIFDDGFHLRLDRSLPSMLIREAPTIVHEFLAKHDKRESDIDYWLFHPGGIKILDFLRETFSLSMDRCRWAYDVLREHGNMSSATILYVLKAFLDSNILQPNENLLIMGIGPGLTVELILLEG